VWLALCAVILAGAAGSALCLMPQSARWLLGPIRTFALAAVLAVVFTHLAPESFVALGPWAVALALVGFVLPVAIERGLAFLPRTRDIGPGRARLEASWLALVVHSIGDGLALATYVGGTHADAPPWDVVVAVAAHTVPVVAVIGLAFRQAVGVRTALSRTLLLGVAAVGGVLLGRLIPGNHLSEYATYVGAAVAGTLLHVVAHDLGSDAPTRPRERVLDALALVAGLSLLLVETDAAETHVSDGRELHTALLSAFSDLAIQIAPLVLAGLAFGALLEGFGGRAAHAFLGFRGRHAGPLRGAGLGVLHPVSACRVVPHAKELSDHGARGALVAAFAIAAPALGLESHTLSLGLIGWRFALVRLLVALAVAVAAGYLLALVVKKTSSHSHGRAHAHTHGSENGLFRSWDAFEDALHHTGAWMLIGLVIAALARVLVPADFSGRATFEALAMVALVALPTYVAPVAALPLAAVLVEKGLAPGIALLGLVLGPVLDLDTLSFFVRTYGRLRTFGIVLVTLVTAGVAALAFGRSLTFAPLSSSAHHPLAIGVTILFAILVARGMYRSGFRGFLGAMSRESIRHSHAAHDAGEGHHHGHAH
jgi:uncharacterized membrane protein YraQ (UPF0718 family)